MVGGKGVPGHVRTRLVGMELPPGHDVVLTFDDGTDHGTFDMQTLPDQEWNTAGKLLPFIFAE
jgi:hypothetical protein